jgi:FkbM family methyltransferase
MLVAIKARFYVRCFVSPRTVKHFAFEPIPELSDELSRNFPKVNVYKLALSDKAGTSTFQHVVSNPSYSGLRRRQFDRPNEVVQETAVRTDLLDKRCACRDPNPFHKDRR